MLDERSIDVEFTVAPGYYMYREKFQFEAAGAELGAPQLPAGKVKFDETFRKTWRPCAACCASRFRCSRRAPDFA